MDIAYVIDSYTSSKFKGNTIMSNAFEDMLRINIVACNDWQSDDYMLSL